MDSLEQAPSAQLTLEGDARGASLEAYASLKDGASAGEPPLDDEVANKAPPTEEVGYPAPRARQPNLALSGARM